MDDLEDRLRGYVDSYVPLKSPGFSVIASRARSRQRRRRIAVSVAGVAVVASVALVVPLLAVPKAGVLQTGRQQTGSGPTPGSASEAPRPAQLHYLPPGVAVLPDQRIDSGGTDVQHTFFGVGTDGHGTIQLITRPGAAVEVYPADGFTATGVIHQRGMTYYESYPRTSFGTFRLDWTDGHFVYSLMVDRLNLPNGPSGVPYDELKRMAFSAS